MKYKNIREEELKNKVGADWFKQFDTTEILGNIDFTVLPKQGSLFVVFQNQGYRIAKENIKQLFDATINIRNKDTYQ